MKKGEGSAVSRFDIFYRAQPHGGSFLAYVDKEEAQGILHPGGRQGSAVVSISVEDGGHTLKITPKGDGPVTLYGVALERTDAGRGLRYAGNAGRHGSPPDPFPRGYLD